MICVIALPFVFLGKILVMNILLQQPFLLVANKGDGTHRYPL